MKTKSVQRREYRGRRGGEIARAVHDTAERRVLPMSTRQQPSTDQAAPSQVAQARLQERIVQFVLDDWMSVPAEREPSRSSPTSLGARILPEVTSCTEVATQSLQPSTDRVGPQDRVFAVRINEGAVTATALVAYLTRDGRLELLQASCDWPPPGQQREHDARVSARARSPRRAHRAPCWATC